jgi:hypothetical protein
VGISKYPGVIQVHGDQAQCRYTLPYQAIPGAASLPIRGCCPCCYRSNFSIGSLDCNFPGFEAILCIGRDRHFQLPLASSKHCAFSAYAPPVISKRAGFEGRDDSLVVIGISALDDSACASVGQSVRATQITRLGRKQAVSPTARLADHIGGSATVLSTLPSHGVMRSIDVARCRPMTWRGLRGVGIAELPHQSAGYSLACRPAAQHDGSADPPLSACGTSARLARNYHCPQTGTSACTPIRPRLSRAVRARLPARPQPLACAPCRPAGGPVTTARRGPGDAEGRQ